MVNLSFYKLQRQLGFQFPNSSVQKQRGSHHTMWWMWKKHGHFIRFYFNMNSNSTFCLKGRQASAKRILKQYSLTYCLQQFYISVLYLRYQTTAIFAGSSSKLGGGGSAKKEKREKLLKSTKESWGSRKEVPMVLTELSVHFSIHQAWNKFLSAKFL